MNIRKTEKPMSRARASIRSQKKREQQRMNRSKHELGKAKNQAKD